MIDKDTAAEISALVDRHASELSLEFVCALARVLGLKIRVTVEPSEK